MLAAFPDEFKAKFFVLLLAGWLGLCVMVGSIYRRMLSDTRRRIVSEQGADQVNRLMRLTAVLGGTKSQV